MTLTSNDIMSIVREFENALFKEWETKYESSNLFCYDGLHCLGEHFKPDGKHWEMQRGLIDDKEIAVSAWEESKMRCMFLTKDHNASEDGEGFDSRIETGIDNRTEKMYTQFYGRWIRLLYGLCNMDINTFSFPVFSSLPEPHELLNAFHRELPCVRINMKKIAGRSTCSKTELQKYINSDQMYIKRQILFYDANVLICCAGSEKDDNPIMQFLFKIYADLQPYTIGSGYNFVYFSPSSHILVLHEWHPSARISYEDYYSAVPQVSSFLKAHPKFLQDFSGYTSDL